MTILKNNKKEKSVMKKVVGAYLPLPLIEYMALHSLGFGSSNSNLIEGLLADWKKASGYTDNDFIKAISERAMQEYNKRKLKNTKYSAAAFIKEIETELREKNISEVFVKNILKKMENATKKK